MAWSDLGPTPAATGGPPPELAVIHPRPGISVIEVRCELDMHTSPALTHLINQELTTRPHAVIVELGGCAFLGSSGLAALVAAATHAQAHTPAIVVALSGMTRDTSRALELTGLDSHFPRYATAVEAVTALTT